MPGCFALEPVTDVAARGRPPEGAYGGALSATQTPPLFAWAFLGHSAARPFLPALMGAPWERGADTAFRTCGPGRQAPRAQTDRPRTSPGSPPSHSAHVPGAQHVPKFSSSRTDSNVAFITSLVFVLGYFLALVPLPGMEKVL